MNPLFRMALLKGSLTSVLMHIRRGAPLNGRDDKGLTPLMLAGAAGRADICRLLLEEGADAAADQNGRTAADLAIQAGHGHMAKVLTLPSSRAFVTAIDGTDSITWPNARPDQSDDWEAEIVFKAATADASVFAQLVETQAAIASAKALNKDVDWQDITIELPDKTPLLGSEISARALQMIREALRDPLVGWPKLAMVARRFAGIEALLEDLGIATTMTDFDTAMLSSSEQLCVRIDDALASDIEDAVEALRVWRPATELYQLEVSRLPVPDRSAEQSMFGALREAKRQVINILLRALPLAGYSLGEAEAGNDNSAELVLDDSAGDLSADDVDDHSEQSLTAMLKAVRDGKCKAEPEAMIDLDLDPRLVAVIASALAKSAAGDTLREQLTSANAEYLRIRNRVTQANLLLVIRYAGRSMRPGVLLEDLIQDGSIGLMRAVERFDVSRGHRFMTYAIWWIRQACSRTAEDHARTIRLPVHLTEQVRRVAGARARLETSLERRPRPEELGAAVGVSPTKAELLDSLLNPTVSIETSEISPIVSQLVKEDEATPFDAAASIECQRIVASVLCTLPAKQERIIRSRFGFGTAEEQTLEEVGAMMSVTRERIRQIEAKAILTLSKRSSSGGRRLRALL